MRCPSDRAQAKLALGPAGGTAAEAGTAARRSEDRLQPTRTNSTKQAQTRITSPQTSFADAPRTSHCLMPVRNGNLRPFFWLISCSPIPTSEHPRKRSVQKPMLQAFAAATLLMLSASISVAQQLPRFDIEATCREAQPLGPEDRDPYQGCMKDEGPARAELQRQIGTVRRREPDLLRGGDRDRRVPELRRSADLPSDA